MNENIIEFRNVSIDYPLRKYTIRAVTDVSLGIKRGKITALVGESGSGKTTLSSSIIQCISEPGRIAAGDIVFFDNVDGEEKEITVSSFKEKEMKPFRWKRVSMVFQAAQSALNPVMTVEQQFVETLLAHGEDKDKQKQRARCKELLEYVKLDAERVLSSYPHELSGGMKQRVMIAFSLLLNPDLIILDEPTTALDPCNRRKVIQTICALPQTILVASHDLDMILDTCSRVILLSQGRIAADGPAEAILRDRELLENNHLELPLCLSGYGR